jgi:signal transduction histidine kinase
VAATVALPESAADTIVVALASFSTYVIVRYLNGKNRISLAGWLFSGLIEITFFVLLWRALSAPVQDVMNNTIIMMMMGLPIIFAGTTIGHRAAVAAAAINVVLQLMVIYFFGADHIPTFSINVYWWTLAITLWLYETTLHKALERWYAIQMQLENLVDERTQALKRAVDELEKSKSQLEEANRELESFSYSVSHDLRAPLRGLDGFSRILLEDHRAQLDADGQRYLERVRAGAQRMGQLIDDLLEFSRLSRQPVLKQTVDSMELVRQVLDELKPDYLRRQVEIVIGDLPVCQADPGLLRQVWANLLSNALKYSRARAVAQIEVGWRSEPGAYFVRDNGAGFDMRYADKLFEVFQRLHSAEAFEGTGVGLAVVKRIVERHGGRIWAEAEVDQGATFYFTLLSAPGLETDRKSNRV